MEDVATITHAQEISKSRVRVRVTYTMTLAYAIAGLGLITWLMWAGKTELAIGVFSGLASTKATIVGFWFGSRGSTRGPSGPEQPEEGSA